MSKCIGCGIKLQNEFKNNLGYTNDLKNKYCARCFKTIHYNEEIKVNNIDNLKTIDKINKLGHFTIFITDLLNINKELIEIFKSINNKKVLVINKCDIIPDNLKLEHIESNIATSFNIKEEIFFISAKKSMYLNRIIKLIEEYEEVIFCGETSSGKSTLINKLLNSNLTTSKYSNTTLSFIKLPYLNYTIYDTPGLMLKEKNINEDFYIFTKQLNEEFVLNIDGLLINTNGNITIYTNHKNISSKKLKEKLDYEYHILANSDIEIDNGFIFIKNPCTINSNRELIIRKSIIGKSN